MHDLASGFAFSETLKKLKARQDQLAKQEDKQHKQLLETRGKLDETTSLMDRLAEYDPTDYQADANRIITAKLRAEGLIDVPIEAPSQESKATKLSADEFLAQWEVAQKKTSRKALIDDEFSRGSPAWRGKRVCRPASEIRQTWPAWRSFAQRQAGPFLVSGLPSG